MDDYQPITLRRLLGPTGAEQLEEVLTDHAIAHQRDGVATDARGYARSKVRVEFELATDTRTGHIRAEIAVRGGLAKLKSFVVPMRVTPDGVLLVECFEDEPEEPQIQLPGVKDPGLDAREAMAAERRRERAIDVGERRREPVDEPTDDAPDESDPITFPSRQRRDATA